MLPKRQKNIKEEKKLKCNKPLVVSIQYSYAYYVHPEIVKYSLVGIRYRQRGFSYDNIPLLVSDTFALENIVVPYLRITTPLTAICVCSLFSQFALWRVTAPFLMLRSLARLSYIFSHSWNVLFPFHSPKYASILLSFIIVVLTCNDLPHSWVVLVIVEFVHNVLNLYLVEFIWIIHLFISQFVINLSAFRPHKVCVDASSSFLCYFRHS